MRIYTVSDIHADYAENFTWIKSLSRQDYRDDILIVSGDVTDDLALLARVFESLQETFHTVLFVPGNHELWVERDEYSCSLDKFEALHELCARLGVITDVLHRQGLSVVPLYSWYDFSFGEPDRHLRRAWRDFRACSWPAQLDDPAAISDYFLALNQPRLEASNDTVISFSHFLPRIDVMPERIPQKRRRVYPVLGSSALGEQVKQLGPDIHIYGHSHVNQDTVIEGVRYINNAFAYPSEQYIARKSLHCVLEMPDTQAAEKAAYGGT